MRILIDSHVFVWAKCAPEHLGHAARAALIDPANEVFVSVATAWELWLKHARTPMTELAPVLNAGAPGFLQAARESGLELLHITIDHAAAAAAALPLAHRDRMFAGQSIAERIVMTREAAFERYRGVQLLDA